MSQQPASASDEDPLYTHKPSLMGAAWELRLRPDALEWRTGQHRGRIPYARISRVRYERFCGARSTSGPSRAIASAWRSSRWR